MDRYQLSREFSFICECDDIQRIDNLQEAKNTAIGLLRQNRAMRELMAELVKSEIPEVSLFPT